MVKNLQPYFANSKLLKTDDLAPANNFYKWDGKAIGTGDLYAMVKDWSPDFTLYAYTKAFDDAGLPDGLVRTVHGGGAIGQALCEASTAKIFFTGSVEVGRKVGEICAHKLKGCVLELGGKDPQIVCADADLANAVSGAVWGGFANAGQTCSGIERVYVHRDVSNAFLEGVVRETERLTVGDPLEWTTETGPMVSPEQADLVTELVDDAIANGAERLCGGPTRVPGLTGAFYAPAVLRRVPAGARILREAVPDPVLAVVEGTGEADAIALVQDGSGAGAPHDRRARGGVVSVWTGDRAKGERVARTLGAELTWVNEHGAVAPGPALRLQRHVRPRQLASRPAVLGGARRLPYDPSLVRARTAAARFAHGRESDRLAVLRADAGPLARAAVRVAAGLLRR